MNELWEWQAYYELEPFGAPAEDERWRTMFTLFYSANSKEGVTIPDFLDRDPEETARLRKRADDRCAEEKAVEFFMTHYG